MQLSPALAPTPGNFKPIQLVNRLFGLFLLSALLFCPGCSSSGTDGGGVTVNSLDDQENPPAGTMTLRMAISQVSSGGTISFAQSLDGGTIMLDRVASVSTILKGELFSMNQGRWVFLGYQERDYGRSALYAAKNITIDASALPRGITVRWMGSNSNRARILAVYGDLTMKNVTLTGGYSFSEPITGGSQPYTLARGGGAAVWGTATLSQCTLWGNHVSGDVEASRDRGAFGGGIYANLLFVSDSVISGNTATGYGAAGGGAYSVGGATLAQQDTRGSRLDRCAVTGNSVTAQHAYGGGIYSDGGGPGSSRNLLLSNCTIARNKVRDNPAIAESAQSQYYYRGGGIYMSNGSLSLDNCTVAENAVNGVPALFSSRPNMAGGGVAATIGDAHVVESMRIQNSIIVGNTLAGNVEDLFAGSLMHFQSYGHNLIGNLDFSQMLVPIPPYYSLNRKHWPKTGDMHGVNLADALDVDAIQRHGTIVSLGTDEGESAVLWYPPAVAAVDRIPQYDSVDFTYASYSVPEGRIDDFLNHVLTQIRTLYGEVVGTDFGSDLGDLAGVPIDASSTNWPSNPVNARWVAIWREIDKRLGNLIGPAQLGEAFWRSFTSGFLGSNLIMSVQSSGIIPVTLNSSDQRGIIRPSGGLGDIGAIETQSVTKAR